MEDLAAWWPKLRPGGLFAGHDDFKRERAGHVAEVRGVAEGAGNKEGDCVSCEVYGQCQDWGLQHDSTGVVKGKAVRSAVDDFAAARGRQVQMAYRDAGFMFFWETWMMRKYYVRSVMGVLAAGAGGHPLTLPGRG